MKKYAITGPRGAIFRVVDEEPKNAQHYVEITEEQAQTISDSEARFFIIDSELKTQQEVFEELQWNTDLNQWGPKPPPFQVTSRQFFKALALDGHGEEEILEKAEQAGFNPTQMLDLKAELKGNYFDRSNPMIAILAPVLGYTTTELVDEVFRKASKF